MRSSKNIMFAKNRIRLGKGDRHGEHGKLRQLHSYINIAASGMVIIYTRLCRLLCVLKVVVVFLLLFYSEMAMNENECRKHSKGVPSKIGY